MNPLLLVWKNCTRKQFRFVLTCLSILVAFFLFTLLSGIITALTLSISSGNQFRLISTHKTSITHSLPLNYQTKIESLDGVDKVTYASWFGGFFKNEKNQLAQFAVESGSYFDVFPEYQVEKSQLQNWKRNRVGILIGQKIADKYQWQVGDKVPIQSSIWANNDNSFVWEFEVMGVYQAPDVATDDSRVFFHHRYFDEYRGYMRNMTSWFTTQLSQSAKPDELTHSIDGLFLNSSFETRTTTEQVFMKEQAQQFADMSQLIKLVVSAVFFTLLLIACNTMIQSIRERMGEIAMMKAIGFSSYQLIKTTFYESLVMLSLGGLSGTLLATISLGLVRQRFAEFLPGITVLTEHYGVVCIYIVLFAMTCTFFPALRIKRLAISDTLGATI